MRAAVCVCVYNTLEEDSIRSDVLYMCMCIYIYMFIYSNKLTHSQFRSRLVVASFLATCDVLKSCWMKVEWPTTMIVLYCLDFAPIYA